MDETRRSVLEMLERFETGMLCTNQPDGTLRARPMAVAEVQDNGDVLFVAGLGSAKIEEVLKDPGVVVTFQSRSRYHSLSGRAEFVADEAAVERVWRPEWKAWFPEGKDDPRLVLLHVRATEAEYWDESGMRGVRFAFEAAKAALKGKRAHPSDVEEHGHVTL
jgi:general stress protein 26